MGPRDGRRLAISALVVVWNVVPFIPIWPGYSGGGDSWFEDWLGPFLFLNAPFWLAVVVLWLRGAKRSRAGRVLRAEAVVVVQAAFFLHSGWWGAAFIALALRGIDGVLLYWLDERGNSATAAEAGRSNAAAT